MDVLQMRAMEEHVKKALYNEANTQTVKIMANLEQATGVKREHLSRWGYLFVGAYLVFGYWAELLCNAIRFLYPAYASIQAIESAGTADDTQWLMYCSVFGMFSLVDMASKDIMAWCPLHWLAKALLLLWLCNPITRGAEQVFKSTLLPALDRYAPLKDGARSPPKEAGPSQAAAPDETAAQSGGQQQNAPASAPPEDAPYPLQ